MPDQPENPDVWPQGREAQRREVQIHGVRLSYLVWGEAQEGIPSLLILHGLLAAAETFDGVVAGLDPGLHVIALDLPGNGYSDRPGANDASVAGLALLVAEFASTVGLTQPVVLGHSHGGFVALRLASASPGALRGVALMAPAHPFGGYSNALVRFYLSAVGRNTARWFLPRVPARLYLFFFRRMPGAREHMDLMRLRPYLHSLRVPGTVPHALRVLQTWDSDMETLRADLEQNAVRLPTLVLWGARDVVVPIASASGLLRHLPSARFVRLEAAGHLPNEEAPAECAAALRAWMEDEFFGEAITRGA